MAFIIKFLYFTLTLFMHGFKSYCIFRFLRLGRTLLVFASVQFSSASSTTASSENALQTDSIELSKLLREQRS
jgi:hypothetical protein